MRPARASRRPAALEQPTDTATRYVVNFANEVGRSRLRLRATADYLLSRWQGIQLLPPGNRKIRFFVNEQERASFAPGTTVLVSCDGCPDNLKASVSRIASQAEFTPPVIYSVESRDKLVYAVDARPDAAAGVTLHPGQPVEVRRE